jgi:hypothetical protein
VNATRRALLLVLLFAAACATGGRRPLDRVREAERDLPEATAIADGPLRASYDAARRSEARGDAAASADVARAEWGKAAAGYAALALAPEGAEWRVPLRHRAAELFLRTQQWDQAQQTATAAIADPDADEASRAVAARLAATAALGAAGAAVKSGELERLDLTRSGQDRRAPPAGWRRFVEAADAYLERADADPESDGTDPDRREGPSPVDLALVAAEVQYAYGDLEDARRRFESVLERWPDEIEALEQLVPLYLGTFATGARAQEAAIERLRERVTAAAARASGASEQEALARTLEALERARTSAAFAAAERLLAAGKAAEAARAFEALGDGPGPGSPANALHNAAVAWDRAREPARAARLRERIVEEHPTSSVAPENALRLAASRSSAGDREGAAALYGTFLERWPDAPGRCVALQNVGSELDTAGRRVEAAARYLVFGADERCAKAAPDLAARALVRAGRIFEAEAKAAYGRAAALPGVTDPEAKGMVSEAKRRMREP